MDEDEMLLDSIGNAQPTRDYVDDSEAASESVSPVTSDPVPPTGAQEDLIHASERSDHLIVNPADLVCIEDLYEAQHTGKSEDVEIKATTLQPRITTNDTANANEAVMVTTESRPTGGSHDPADSSEPDLGVDGSVLLNDARAGASAPDNAPIVEEPAAVAQTALTNAIPAVDASQVRLEETVIEPTTITKPTASTETTNPPQPAQPPFSPLEQQLADLQAQSSMLVAQFASNPTVAARILCHKQAVTTTTKRATNEDAEAAMKVAKEVVREHIELLHRYNEIRDVGQGLIGMIADQRGMRIKDVMEEFGMGERD